MYNKKITSIIIIYSTSRWINFLYLFYNIAWLKIYIFSWTNFKNDCDLKIDFDWAYIFAILTWLQVHQILNQNIFIAFLAHIIPVFIIIMDCVSLRYYYSFRRSRMNYPWAKTILLYRRQATRAPDRPTAF